MRDLQEWWDGGGEDEDGLDPLLALADEAAGLPTPANCSSQKVPHPSPTPNPLHHTTVFLTQYVHALQRAAMADTLSALC